MEIDNRVTGKTKIMGIIGNPIEHSISPQLHNSINKLLDMDCIYIPYKVQKHDLENAVNGLKALGVVGFNVTIPYKKDVMRYLEENSKEALLMGAVNTVKSFDGRLYGYNTDAEGFSRSFKEQAGVGFEKKRITIIGSGGAARAIAVKVALEGADKIYITNRTIEKSLDLAEVINNNVSRIVEVCNDKNLNEAFLTSDIIINTTSIGMHPNTDESPMDRHIKLSGNQIVYDVIYNPVKTRFLIEAENYGCKVVNGLGMLFYQGIYAYEIWTGAKLDDGTVNEIYKSFMNIL